MEDHQVDGGDESLQQKCDRVVISSFIVDAKQYQPSSKLQRTSPPAVSILAGNNASEDAQLCYTLQQHSEIRSSLLADGMSVGLPSPPNREGLTSIRLVSTSDDTTAGDFTTNIEYLRPCNALLLRNVDNTAEQSQRDGTHTPHTSKVVTSFDTFNAIHGANLSPNTSHMLLPQDVPLSVSAFDDHNHSHVNIGSRLMEELATLGAAKQENLFEDYTRPAPSTSPLLTARQPHFNQFASPRPSEIPSSSPGVESPDYDRSSDGVEDESSDPTERISIGDTDDRSKLDDGLWRQSLRLPVDSLSISPAEDPYSCSVHASRFQGHASAQRIFDSTDIHGQAHDQSLAQSHQPLLMASTRTDYASTDVSQEQGLSAEEEDLSPLEYARKNGLSRNYLQAPYPRPKFDLLGDYQPGFSDDSQLTQFDLTANVNTDERLTISKDAMVLLNSVSREGSAGWVDGTILRMIDTRKSKNLKFELPLLKSEHETDCKNFAQRKGFEVELRDVKLPLEMVDEENGGGLRFPPGMWTKGDDILETLRREKLEVTKDTLVYLQGTLKNDWTDDDRKIWETACTYRRNTTLEPVTPPLSPLISPGHLFEPSTSDSAFDLPILSDPESLSRQDLDAIEKKLFEDDVPTPIRNARDRNELSDALRSDDICFPPASLDQNPASPKFKADRYKQEDYKVEEPLTPARQPDPPKAVRLEDLAMQCPITTDSPFTDPFVSTFFEEAFGAAHEKATRMSEQEKLIAADTTARVDVPIMDFSLPIPPWQKVNCTPKSLNQYALPKWGLTARGPKRWSPFPHDLAKVALEERFVGDDSTWQAFVQEPTDSNIINTSNLTWKPPGLRIIREDNDDDEEIDHATFKNGVSQDLSYLIKKRKMEIEEREVSGLATHSSNKQPPRKKTPKTADFVSTVMPSDQLGEQSALMGGAFSIGTSVDKFLEIRGLKKPRLTESSTFTKTIPHRITSPVKLRPQPEPLAQFSRRISPTPNTAIPLPAPRNNIVDTPVNVIVASSLLKHRILVRHIEALAPKIVLVERDFSAHDTMTWMPGSVTRSPIASPLASEADIVVSPFLGIILTTLQKIKQQPLPGQKARAAIRERLLKVSVRYERLIVLVTEGRADESVGDLDDNDCIAFSEFVAFAINLPTTVNVQFIGGGEATLAKWVVSSISSNKVDLELLADETHWELFLRRAGLNAFAAQAIIAEVKAPDRANNSNPSTSRAAQCGLSAFVEMGGEHRLARFGPICGNRLMERVGAIVDARWS